MTMVLVAGADPGVTARAAGRSAHRERGQLYAATVEGVGVTVADLAMGTAAVFVEMEQMAGVTAGEVPVRPAEVLIGSPVWRFAASKGLVALHAGAVTGELGTVVVRGPAGRGKSTAVLAAGHAGWSVLADETVWFDPLLDPPVLRATGMPIQIEREDGSKGPPDAGPLTPMRFCTVAPLGCTVFLAPRERHGAGSWHPLDADSALAAFAAGAHPGEGTQARERIARARSALLSGGCYELVAGSPDTLADQLTAIASHARRPAHAQGPGPSR
jgi:hypothetical protein